MEISKDNCILALSGGPDSVYLLHRLLENGCKPILAHFNHKLRGKESDKDEEFVCELAKTHNLICEVESQDVKKWALLNKKSIEEAGRLLRYEFFEQVRQKYNGTTILTAHHLNDQVETIIMNVHRGCELRGLRGMPERNGYIFRPLLDTPKKEILDYLKEHNLPYRTDASNKNTKTLRNWIRNEMIPQMLKVNPSFVEQVVERGRRAKPLYASLKMYAAQWLEQNNVVDRFPVTEFQRVEDVLKPIILETLYERAYGSTHQLTSALIEHVLELLKNGTTGKEQQFGKEMTVRIQYGEAVLSQKNQEIETVILELQQKSLKRLPKQLKEKPILYFDADRIPRGLLNVRSWKAGDRFQPSGMVGTKKIQDHFVDLKIPQEQRPYIPILTNRAGEIVAVGTRIDERFKATKNSKNILAVRFKRDQKKSKKK